MPFVTGDTEHWHRGGESPPLSEYCDLATAPEGLETISMASQVSGGLR